MHQDEGAILQAEVIRLRKVAKASTASMRKKPSFLPLMKGLGTTTEHSCFSTRSLV